MECATTHVPQLIRNDYCWTFIFWYLTNVSQRNGYGLKRVALQFIVGRQTIVAYPILMVPEFWSIAKLMYCNSTRSELVSLPTESIVQNFAPRILQSVWMLVWGPWHGLQGGFRKAWDMRSVKFFEAARQQRMLNNDTHRPSQYKGDEGFWVKFLEVTVFFISWRGQIKCKLRSTGTVWQQSSYVELLLILVEYSCR